MPRGQSLAEYYRAHREAFLLAQELGCTPKEAEAEIARIAARERARAISDARDRLHARMNAPLRPGMALLNSTGDEDRDPQPWMMRD